jgi:hypothetical protein
MRRPARFVRLAGYLALALTVLTTGPIAADPAPANRVTALVPAYFYPTWWIGSPWDDLNAAAARIPVEAIMNPDSGPGNMANSDYQHAVGALQAAGGRVIGYVATGYGSRTAGEILGEVSSYLDWYGVDGIFLDEMGNQSGDLDYVALYTSIKAMGADLHVVGNPGIPFVQVEAYLEAADTLVIFEGPLTNADPNGASFREFPDRGPYAGLPLWFTDLCPSRLANIVFDVPTRLNMLAALPKAVCLHAGYVYLTDDQLPNPYDTLPSYWDLEVDAIEYLNSFR